MTAHVRRSTSFMQRIREHWKEFKASKPGHRFQDRYRRRRSEGHSLLVKALSLTIGLFLFLIGLVLMPAPGPGILVVVIGAGMIAEESKLAARALDALELRLRRLTERALRFWRGASLAQKALVIVLALIAAGLFALAALSLFFDF